MCSAEILATCLFSFALALFWKLYSGNDNFPPGPKRIPIAGSALLMPTKDEYRTFSQWANRFGNIVGLKIFGQRLVILNTSEIANELLNTRNTLYSYRPCFPMLEMMMFPTWNIGIMNTGNTHRLARRVFGQVVGSKSIHLYHSIMTHEVKHLLKNLKHSPSDFVRHLRRSNANITLGIFYGIRPDQVENENLVTLNDQLLDATSLAGAPLGYLVNNFPILKYWPRFLPGGGFKADVEAGCRLVEDLLKIPIVPLDTKEMPFLSMHNGDENERKLARSISATSFSAGVETSTSVFLSFILAMVLYPDVQRKAQSEIDTKIPGELPTIEDRLNNLPYLSAILSECYRWAPPVHLGVPHFLSQGDSIDGYVLPRGTVVLPNIWNILHDTRHYKDPMNFVPERFLGSNAEPDPRGHVYGYGRRICPGRYLAEDNLWLTMANMLAVFQFRKAIDTNGQPITPAVRFTSGVMNRPQDFPCIIEPRSAKAAELILNI